MSYKIEISDEAKTDLGKLRQTDKRLYQKAFDLLMDIIDTPRAGIGKPEALKGYGAADVWSRRIDERHRLVYVIHDDIELVGILSAFGHYDDH
jgi:toxin YoeB